MNWDDSREENNFDFDFDFDFWQNGKGERIFSPKKHKALKKTFIKYDNAKKLAQKIDVENGREYELLVSGNFIFGDFIEALIVENNFHVKNLTISTLSMDYENVDSLKNLIEGEYIEEELNLIVSSFFYAHEKFKIIPYIYEELDVDNKFQLAVCASHTKTVLIELMNGMKITINGSANLRSSDNLETFSISTCEDKFDFFKDWQMLIIKDYKTINKEKRGKELWHLMQEAESQKEARREKRKAQNVSRKEKNNKV